MNSLERIGLSLPQVATETRHLFCDGMYAREIEAKAGTILIGHKHKQECFNVLSKGRMQVKDINSDAVYEIAAPCTFVTSPGVQKMAVVLEDCVFTNFFATAETDLTALEAQLVEKSPVFIEWEDKQCHLLP